MRKAIGCAALSCAFRLAHAGALKWSQDNYPRWVPPQETPVGYMLKLGNIDPPMTTAAPKPSKVRAVLEARDTDDNTCGYVSGIPTSSLWCDSTARCVYNSINSHIGCCDDTTSNCPIWTTCYDSTDRDSYTTNNGRTLWCGNDEYPYCHTHLYQDDALIGYTLLGCAVAAGSGQLWYSSTPTSTSSTTPITDPSTFSDDPTPTPSPTRDSTSTTPPPPPAPSSSTPVGAIVGGVVGGLGALALIVLGIWLLMRMHDKQKKNDAAAAAAAGMATQQPPPPPPGGAGGNGDPHMSQLPAHQQQQQQPPQPYYTAAAAGYTKPHAGHASVAYSTTTTTTSPTLVGGGGGYDQSTIAGTSPPSSPPLAGPGPAPGYHQVQAHGTPSPPPQMQGQMQGQQQQQFGQYGNMSPGAVSPGTQGGYQHPQAHQQQGYGVGDGYGYAAELPAQRGDGELRELQ